MSNHFVRRIKLFGGEKSRPKKQNTLILSNRPEKERIWYPMDEAPPHNFHLVGGVLTEIFDHGWIGNNEHFCWPPRTPDGNPLDYFGWGDIKNMVYATPVTTKEGMHLRVRVAVNTLTPDFIRRATDGSIGALVEGSCIVWTSPVIPQLTSNNTDINPLGRSVSSYEISLIASLLAIGSVFSPFFCGRLVNGIGRKNTLLVLGMFNTFAFLLLAFASNVVLIYLARTINGLCVGGTSITIPIFISEITDDHNRGKFGCFLGLFLPLGQLYAYVMGSLLPMKYFTLMCMIPLVFQNIMMLVFIPETPVYLLHKGRRISATKSLQKYRSHLTAHEIEKEIELLEYTIESTSKASKGNIQSLFSYRPARRGFCISLGLYLIQMGTGIAVLFPFMGPIFEEAKIGISGNMTAILVGLLKIGVFFFVAHIIDRVGRKPLMFFSIVLCSASLLFLGIYFYMKENDISSYKRYVWVPVLSIFSFVIAYSLGAGPIPTATIGEMFASNIRSTAVSTINFFSRIFYSLLLALFPIARGYIGVSGTLWSFCFFCILGSVFVYIVMPETKGKTIYGIQEILKGKKHYSKVNSSQNDCL